MARKYTPESLLPALRLFAQARNQALAAGFTDNGGAIYSAARILDILGLRLRYPHLSSVVAIKKDPDAERSVAADAARRAGQPVNIEHVMPQRAFTQAVIAKIDAGSTDVEITEYVGNSYRLVLLTPEETQRLNQLNRSKLSADRIADAGIVLFGGSGTPPGGSTHR